jgi:hypothetical protein
MMMGLTKLPIVVIMGLSSFFNTSALPLSTNTNPLLKLVIFKGV